LISLIFLGVFNEFIPVSGFTGFSNFALAKLNLDFGLQAFAFTIMDFN